MGPGPRNHPFHLPFAAPKQFRSLHRPPPQPDSMVVAGGRCSPSSPPLSPAKVFCPFLVETGLVPPLRLDIMPTTRPPPPAFPYHCLGNCPPCVGGRRSLHVGVRRPPDPLVVIHPKFTLGPLPPPRFWGIFFPPPLGHATNLFIKLLGRTRTPKKVAAERPAKTTVWGRPPPE